MRIRLSVARVTAVSVLLMTGLAVGLPSARAADTPTLVNLQVSATQLGSGGPTQTAKLTVITEVTGLPAGARVVVDAQPSAGSVVEGVGARWTGIAGNERWRTDLALFSAEYDLEVFLLNDSNMVLGFVSSLDLANRGLPWHVSVTSNPPGAVTAFHRAGYWLTDARGSVYPFGDAPFLGQLGVTGPQPAAPIVALLHRQGSGDYDLFAADGSSFGFWVASKQGPGPPPWDTTITSACPASPPSVGQHYVTAVLYPDAGRCWAFTEKGFVFSTLADHYFGDLVAFHLNGPVINAVATPSGHGYYMVASDGGVFSFGDAAFHGSMGGQPLAGAVVELVPDYDGVGYWLVASDGGIFAFDAEFHGSMGDKRLNQPMVGMVRYGGGYLMVASDGGVFNFSSLPFSGSLGASPPTIPITHITPLEE